MDTQRQKVEKNMDIYKDRKERKTWTHTEKKSREKHGQRQKGEKNMDMYRDRKQRKIWTEIERREKHELTKTESKENMDAHRNINRGKYGHKKIKVDKTWTHTLSHRQKREKNMETQ